MAALAQLDKATGIVFDFRGYPSHISPQTFFPHLSKTVLTSPQWLIPLVTRPDRQNMTFARGGEWNLFPAPPYLTARRAFIIDGRAISYAESCLGIVEHYHLGEFVGSPTAGTNGNVNPFTLPGGYRVTWTGMKVLKQDGGAPPRRRNQTDHSGHANDRRRARRPRRAARKSARQRFGTARPRNRRSRDRHGICSGRRRSVTCRNERPLYGCHASKFGRGAPPHLGRGRRTGDRAGVELLRPPR